MFPYLPVLLKSSQVCLCFCWLKPWSGDAQGRESQVWRLKISFSHTIKCPVWVWLRLDPKRFLPTLLHCQVIQAIWGSNWMNKPIALQFSRSKVIDSSGKSCTWKHEDKLLRNMEGWWKEHLHFKRGDPSFNSDPCASAAPPFWSLVQGVYGQPK